jgi:UDP-N-acetylmuramoyl-L-alanyl-D-glutamate--2,6-diaminopimelate ligase
MIGDHHVYNCLSAAATCLVMGVDLLTIARGLERVEAVPGRLERIECGQPFGVYVDSAQSPDTMAVGLRALKQVTAGRLICVFGLDSSCDPQHRPLVGRVVEKGAELSVITSSNPRHESPLQIAHDILDGYDQPGRPHVIPNREKAIVWALTQARPGDTVLVAGRGCQSTQQVGFKHVELDDRQVVRRWLYDVAPRMDYATPATYSLQ